MNLADRLHLEGLRALQAKDYRAAVGFLDAAVIEDPLIAQAHNNRGLALRLLGRAFDATLAFERAISLNSYYIDAHFNLGAVLQEEGSAASAEHQYRKVVCLDAEHLVAHYSLAEVLAASKRVEEAALHLSMCVSLDPEDRLGASLFLAALDKGPLPAKASKAFIHRLYQRRAAAWDQISGYEAGHLHQLPPIEAFDAI